MHCIDFFFFVIFKFCVKQLTIFERTVVAASYLKNCTVVYCDTGQGQIQDFWKRGHIRWVFTLLILSNFPYVSHEKEINRSH